jgi:hypothetical protein
MQNYTHDTEEWMSDYNIRQIGVYECKRALLAFISIFQALAGLVIFIVLLNNMGSDPLYWAVSVASGFFIGSGLYTFILYTVQEKNSDHPLRKYWQSKDYMSAYEDYAMDVDERVSHVPAYLFWKHGQQREWMRQLVSATRTSFMIGFIVAVAVYAAGVILGA